MARAGTVARRSRSEEGMQDAILPLSKIGGPPTGITRLHAELLRRLLFLSSLDKTRSVQGLGGLDCYDGIVGWRGKQRAVFPAVTVWFGIE
jgi:hypothetical protein